MKSNCLQSFQGSQAGSLGIKTPKGVAAQQQRGGYVHQVVCPEPVFGRMTQAEFLELPLEVRNGQHNGSQQSSAFQILSQTSHSRRDLFGSDMCLTEITRAKEAQLQSVTDFHPKKPAHRERPCAGTPCSLSKAAQSLGVRHFQVVPGEEVSIGVRFQSPRISLSNASTNSCGSGLGKIPFIRARCSAYSFCQGAFLTGASSGRTVYLRPSRRWMRTAPCVSQASSTSPGLRSKSRTVNVFMSDNMSDIGLKVKRLCSNSET